MKKQKAKSCNLEILENFKPNDEQQNATKEIKKILIVEAILYEVHTLGSRAFPVRCYSDLTKIITFTKTMPTFEFQILRNQPKGTNIRKYGLALYREILNIELYYNSSTTLY